MSLQFFEQHHIPLLASALSPRLKLSWRKHKGPYRNQPFEAAGRQAPRRVEACGRISSLWLPFKLKTAPRSLSDSYKVRYSSVIAEPTGQWSNYVYSEIPSVTLTGLVPGNRYRFQVKAYSHGTYSEATTIEESIGRLQHVASQDGLFHSQPQSEYQLPV